MAPAGAIAARSSATTEDKTMRMHKSITAERVMDAVERRMTTLDDPGFCVACGEEADGCEPDAQGYECEHCGEHKVYGADELLFRFA
jgi:hypothetical protein